MMALSLGALFLAVAVGTASAGHTLNHVVTNTCASSCSESTSKFGYEVGKSYRYAYKSDVVTEILGSNSEKSKLNVDAVAHIEVLSQCEMLLKLTDVVLTDTHPDRPDTKTNVERAWEFKRDLQLKSLRFAFQDGRVEAVCPEQGEKTWALNIKRAVISGLQNTMHDLDTHTRNKESDVSGDCYVDYSVATTWNSYKITKVKDVLSCSGHAHYDPFLHTTKFGSNSRIQSLPLMKTTHQCEQVINRQKIISSAACTERHVFRPFSTELSGAITVVTFSLEYKTVVSGNTVQGNVAEHKSLVFDYDPTSEEAENRRGVVEVKTALSTLCTQTNTVVDPAAPATFSKLIQKMRQLTPEQLSNAHTQIKASPPCVRAESFFHDAIPVLGTPASARLMRVLLTSGDMTSAEADKWLTSMSFMARPTRALLADVKELLVQNISIRKSTLAVTSLVNNYCNLYTDCGDHQEVRDIISILDQRLGYNCAAQNKADYNKVMLALKGIGNAGHAERVVPKLNRCLLNTNLPIELRVTVVSAFRRMACTADRDDLVRVFADTREDAELRLAAYLGLMACPTRDILNRVNSQLGREEANQVGSFIWTHLTNLQTTASPLKQDIRRILENEVLKKVFDMDKRKFSRNVEWSTFSESINAGVTVDSNLIWSPKSFLPRSASLNLTVDIFGESLDIVEVGARTQGIDNLLEGMFGPAKGMDNNVQNDSPRRRNSANKLTNMDPLHQQFGLEKDTPKGSYFLRVFGNEINFDDIQEFDYSGIYTKLEQTKLKVEQFMSKRHSIDHTCSGVLFDVAMVVPTVAGFPLRLRTDGTSVVNVKVEGKFDLRRIFEKMVDIEGTVRPSAAIQINADMSVDATMARSGVRMVNTIRSNSVLAGKLEIRPGGVVNLDINMPDDNIQLLDASSKFYIEYRNDPQEQAMITEGRIEKRMCTDAELIKVTGLELCAQLSAPNANKVPGAPYFPFTGPSSVSLVLSKKDTYRGMHFETRFTKEQVAGVTGTKDTIKIQFLTPGSRIDRELTFEYVLDNPKKQVNLNLKSPWKTVEFTGSLLTTDARKQLKATVQIDEEDTYDLLTRCDQTKNKFNTQTTHLVEFTVPRKPVYRLTGSSRYRAGKKIEVDLRVENVLERPLSIKGSIDYVKRLSAYNGNVDLESSVLDAKVQGSVILPTNKYEATTDLSIEYQKVGSNKHTLTHKLEWNLASIKPKFEVLLKSGFTTSQWPSYNSDIDFKVAADSNAGMVNLIAGLTGSPKRLTFSTTYEKIFRRNIKTGEATVSIVLPYMTWNTNLVGTIHMQRDLFKAELQRQVHSQTSKLKFHLERKTTQPLNTLLELSYIARGRRHIIKDTVVESSSGMYNHNLDIELDENNQLHMISTLKINPRPEITAEIRISKHKDIKLHAFVTPSPTDFSSLAKLEYGTDEYSTSGSWKIARVSAVLSADAKFDLVYPARTITLKGAINLNRKLSNTEFELKWDAINDESKRIMLKTELSGETKNPRINVRTEWYPSKFFDVTLTGRNAKKTWRHPERDLEVKFNFLSSFANARQVSTSITHVATSTKIITQSEIFWGTNKKISTVVTVIKRNGWQDALITVVHTMPFDNMKKTQFVTDYSIRGITFDVKHRLDWDNKFVQLSLTSKGDLSKHDVEGGLTILTSYPDYNRMALIGKHTDNGRIFKSQFQGTWWDGKSMTMALNANHARQGWYVTNSGDLSISLPLGHYRNNKLTWNHVNNANLLKTHLEVDVDNEKSIWDLDTTLSDTNVLWGFDIKTKFKSPYQYVRDLAFNINHRRNAETMEGVSTGMLVKWAPERIVTIVNTFSFHRKGIFRSQYEITTPYEGFKTMTVLLENKKIGDRFEFTREFTWESNKILCDGYVMMTFPKTSGSIRLLTPYEIADRTILSFENKKVDGIIWHSKGRLDYPGKNRVQIFTQLGFEAEKKLTVEIKTPSPYLELFFFDLDHRGSLDNFRTKIQMEHNMMEGRVVVNLQSDVSILDDIKVQLGFTSPYEQITFVRTGFTHSKVRDNYNTAYTFEYPAYKVAVANELILNGPTDFDETLTLNYAGNTIKTGLKFIISPVFKFVTFLNTPFEGYTSTSIDLQFDNQRNVVASTVITYGTGNEISANMDYRNVNGKVTGDLVVSTPFTRYETSTLRFNHQGRWNNFKNGAILIVGGRTFESRGEFLYRSNKMKVGGTVKTPYEAYRTITFSFDHEGVSMDMKQAMEFTYGENNIKITHEFRFKNNRLIHKLLIVTPFLALTSLRSEVKHTGPLKNFKNQGTLEYNGRTYTGNTQFVYGKKAIRGTITVNAPEKYQIRFNHKGENNEFTNNIVAEVDGRSYSANTQFKLVNNNLDISTNVRTPHPQMRVMSASVKHQGRFNNFQNSFEINLNRNKYTGESQYKLAGTNLAAGIELKLPEVYSINVAHKGALRQFENTAEVIIDTAKYEAGSSFRYQNEDVTGSITFKLPREYSLAVSHKGSALNFENNFNLKYGLEQASGSSKFVYAPNDLLLSAEVTVPTDNHVASTFKTKLQHKGDGQHFTTEGILKLPLTNVQKLNFKVTHQSNSPDFNTNVMLGFNKRAYGFALNHEGNSNDFMTKAIVDIGTKKSNMEIKWKQTGTYPRIEHAGSVSIVTPYKHLTSAETRITHSIMNNAFNGGIESFYNTNKYLDVGYTFNNEAKKSISFTITEPHSAFVIGNFEGTQRGIDASSTVNWDTTDTDSNVKVIVSAKRRPSYELELQVIQPRRTSIFKTDLELRSEAISHGTTVQWGQGPNKKFAYQLTASKTSTRRNSIYSGTFNLQSPHQNMETSLQHEFKSHSVKTVFEIGNIEKLTIIHDFQMKEPGFRNFQSDLIVKHPALQKDIKTKFAGILSGQRYYGEARINVEFANDDIFFEGKLGDASTSDKSKYIGMAKLNYPRVNIDSQALIQASANGPLMTTEIRLDHLAALDGQWKSLQLKSNLNKADDSMDFELKSPYNDDLYVRGVLLAGQESGVYNVDVTSQMGSRRVKAVLALDRNAPLMDFKLNYKPDHEFHMYAKYLSLSTAQFEIHREFGGSKVIDSQFAIRLNNSRIIHARAYFRPAVITEIEAALAKDLGVQTFITDLQEAIKQDVNTRITGIQARLQVIADFMETISGHIDSTFSGLRTAYTDAYNADKFYLRTTHLFIRDNSEVVQHFATSQYNKLRPAMEAQYDRMSTHWQQTKEAMAERRRTAHANFVTSATEAYNSFATSVTEFKNRIKTCLYSPWFGRMADRYTAYKASWVQWYRDTASSVSSNPAIVKVTEWASSIPQSEYMQPLRDLHMQTKAHFVGLHRRYQAAYTQAYNQLGETFNSDDMKAVQQWYHNKVIKGKQTYQYFGLAKIENYLKNLDATKLDELKNSCLDGIANYLKVEKTRITVWAPQTGDFQAELYLPVGLHNIRDFPVDEWRRMVTRMRNTIARLTPDEDWVPWDTIYAYKPRSMNPLDWLPPFKSHATIAGNQHYMTFDRTFYEFAGECSYVLAHDFIDKNFTVIVNYAIVDSHMTKKSMTVLSSNKQIEIFPSFKVTVDSKQTELPYEFGDLSIMRYGNRIRLDNTNGVTVSCDLAYDRCTVNVTGWYFAKTAGMLGTYNNEQYDDLLTADHRITTRPELLADSWTVGSKCRAVNTARVEEPTDAPVCAKYFKDESSPFRMCFKQVEPSVFMDMCLHDMSAERRVTDVCQVSAFYVDECNRAGVPLRQISPCVTCKLNNWQQFSENNDQKLEGSRVKQSADVVFVISKKSCNSDIIPKLPKLINMLDDTLVAKGLRSNRYGVIGFAGDGALEAPHSHTIEGQLFNRNLKVGKIIGDLRVTTDDSTKETAIDALDLAARYPFRPGVSKTIILLTCEPCSKNMVSYPDMVELLLNRDIKLHLFTPHDFRMKSNSPKSSNIWGMTRYTVFTNKHASNLDGDVTLRGQTYMPKDLCAALSHETEGAIFNSKKFADRKVKDFRTVLTGVMAGVAKPAACQICQCIPDQTGVGQSVCRSCVQRQSFFGVLPGFEGYEDMFAIPEPSFEAPQRTPKNKLKVPRRRIKKSRKQM